MRRIDPDAPLSTSCRLTVPFNDLDPAGMVWHGRYMKYFELSRARLMDELGYGYAAMHDSGLIWPVVDVHVRHLKPLRLNQHFEVFAVLREWEVRLKVQHEIVNESGELCARATTIQVPVDAATMEIRFGAPAELIDKVESRLKSDVRSTN